jgi:hypothetical protein
VELPQLPVNYEEMAKKLFDVGSGSSVSKSSRDTLYRLSKYFKVCMPLNVGAVFFYNNLFRKY